MRRDGPPRVGDCNGDQQVTIDELVTGVGIALEQPPIDAAAPTPTPTATSAVRVDELVAAVDAALNGVPPPLRAIPTRACCTSA